MPQVIFGVVSRLAFWVRWGRVRSGVLLFALLLGAAGIPVAAHAQNHCRDAMDRMDRVQRELDQARDKLRDCRSPEARKFYEGAVESLHRARGEAGRGECRRGEILTEAAIRLAGRALDSCREGDGQRDQLGRFLDRTETILRDAHDAAAGVGGECETLLRVAVEDQRKARDAFRSDRLRISLKLTLRSQELCERVIACVDEGGLQGEVPVQSALLRTDHFLDETERLLRDRTDAEPALVVLRNGRRIQEQAWRSFRSGRFPLSLGLTRQARSLANQALLQLEVDPDAEDVLRVIVGTEEFLARLEPAASRSESPQTRALLRRARDLSERARAALARDDAKAALVQIRAANGLALDAAVRLENGEDR